MTPLAWGIVLGLLAPNAQAIYVDTPIAPGATASLLELTPPGLILPPGGVLSPRAGRLTLLPGPGGGPVTFLPDVSSGASLCQGGSNAAIAGVICGFTDNVAANGVGWLADFAVHNPNAGVVRFNASFFDGAGNVYAGRAALGAGSTLYVQMLVPDHSGAPFMELGVSSIWAASSIPAAVAPAGMDVSFSVMEGVAPIAGLFACPGGGGPQGATPQGNYGCSFRFMSSPDDEWLAGALDPALPTLGILDPDDRTAHPELFPDLQPVPEPKTWALLLLGLLAVVAHRRRA
ncbi:MAG: PEP-CTERM sorting domain-containing protein [Burkholderiales bacterium]|nr:PEP-CTERM sorting domain-containing protein [Burkholderiales bacterium]